MKEKSMSFLLHSKLFTAALAGSFLSPFFGTPEAIVAVVSATAGAVGIELGRLALQLKKQDFEMRNALKENPVSYIVDARAKLEPTMGRKS